MEKASNKQYDFIEIIISHVNMCNMYIIRNMYITYNSNIHILNFFIEELWKELLDKDPNFWQLDT